MDSSLQSLDIPLGYKLTEVGVIPQEWESKLLGDLGDVVRGGSPRPAGDNRFFNGSFIPWLTVASLTNIPESKLYVTETSSCLTELGSKQSRTLAPETLIISNSGATLGVAKILGIKCCANDGIAAIINQKCGHKPFLVHYLNTKTKELHDTVATGNGQPNLNTALIKNIRVPFPALEEQTAIANALSDVDALIQELEKLIAKKQAIKTATMQQLLTGRTRLPAFAYEKSAHHPDGRKKGYKPSELGEIPEDWEVVRLGDVGETIIGLTYSPNDVAEYGTLVLRSSNVQQGKLAYSDCVYVNMSLPDRVIVREGDILVCVRNGSRQLIGKCALIDKKAEGHAFGAFMSIYRTKYSKFVFYQFQSDLIQSQINEMMGATINQITNKDMASFLIGLPCDAKEQTAIAQICSDIDEEIQALEMRLNKTRQIKQGMMQELLTGKTRLVKPAGVA
ncbi:restriction endonuclease subunit S [Shewanella baltica]|uniref:restriction endonuclease subunit S n=1 Tax=Shewanella baltica TaxID=62322 RepID=UPI000D3B4463|nr:restriction endonuclease subunit S [Shewanella baltica]